jgi:hypothetical protein
MAVFMLSMIFAFSLVAMATVVMTVFALSLVRGLLEIGQFLSEVRAPEDAKEVALRPSRAIS